MQEKKRFHLKIRCGNSSVLGKQTGKVYLGKKIREDSHSKRNKK